MNMLQSGVGILCLRVLANGMQSGLTSPARPWFSLDLTNKAVLRNEVKDLDRYILTKVEATRFFQKTLGQKET